MNQRQLIRLAADAAARAAGFYAENRTMAPLSRTLNNPGLLGAWKDPAGQPYPNTGVGVQFPDLKAGWSALNGYMVIQLLKRRMSLRELLWGKAGLYRGYPVMNPVEDREAFRNTFSRDMIAHGVADPDRPMLEYANA